MAFESILRAKLSRGLAAAAQKLAEEYSEDVDVPVEGPSRHKYIRSQPGEYPRKETGEGQEAIGWDVDPQRLESAVGMKAGGEHMFYLRGEKYQRKYIDDTLFENLEAIRQAFIDGTRG